MQPDSENKIAVIGLGYVGLPLAVAFSRKYTVTGYDINAQRIAELNASFDRTQEIPEQSLSRITNLKFSNDQEILRQCNIYIVTVPTPVDQQKKPNLAPLLTASKTIGNYLKTGDIVIYESTVYPGCTEEDCVPVFRNAALCRGIARQGRQRPCAAPLSLRVHQSATDLVVVAE